MVRVDFIQTQTHPSNDNILLSSVIVLSRMSGMMEGLVDSFNEDCPVTLLSLYLF